MSRRQKKCYIQNQLKYYAMLRNIEKDVFLEKMRKSKKRQYVIKESSITV